MSKREEADSIVRWHVLWSMGAGLIPIPLVDFAAVTAVQVDMLNQLASAYDVEHDEAIGKTFVTALAGTTFAKVGSSLIKAIPGVGMLIGGVSMSVLSGASTYAVAQVAIHYFESGGTLKNLDWDTAKKMYDDAFEEGKEYASKVKKEQDQAPEEDAFAKLEKLGKLKEQGVITEEEFEAKKKELLEQV